ncbi:SET domain-containing protein 4 [Ostrinia nubilalis]|uniref:SET domain-containing protein 4 n=1 Tax=Ostrinia nubilalis TaxID=29057 RepID=UPI0030825055
MGRTQRKRKQNKVRNFRTCDDEKDLILLNTWLSKQSIRRNEKLVLAVFEDTGRGVLTKRKILAGEELINLPLNSTLNVITILTDQAFCSIFLENKSSCLLDYKQSVSFQSLLAFYLTYLKVQGSETKWHLYLNSLPREYTVPYFLPSNIQCDIHSDIQTVISKQTDIIRSSYDIFYTILRSSASKNNFVAKFQNNFDVSVYEWAYFTVNTRCVFMDLTNVLNLKNVSDSILNLINDNTKISLCPYLDMINHSANARNETKLMVRKSMENVNIVNLDQDFFSDVWFSIYTKNNFEPFTQVFICYGDSHNLKLITEYGFFLPDNDLDYVCFPFEDIVTYLGTKSIKLSQEQCSFITSHGLNKDLYIDFRGLSFNLYGLLMVVKYYYDHSKDVSRLLYSAAVCSSNKDLNDIITPLVMNKVKNIKESINRLRNNDSRCVILSNCVELMCQYVNILEKFIKC